MHTPPRPLAIAHIWEKEGQVLTTGHSGLQCCPFLLRTSASLEKVVLRVATKETRYLPSPGQPCLTPTPTHTLIWDLPTGLHHPALELGETE